MIVACINRCADYLKHILNTTQEKESAVSKLKSDLDVKQRQLEEDNADANERSDPESVTSSLTEDSTGSSRQSSTNNQSSSHSSGNSSGDQNDKKRKATTTSDTDRGDAKKHCVSSSEAATEESSGEGRGSRTGSGTGSGNGSGSGSGNGSGSGGGTTIGKTVSTVSDLTESNRFSSGGGTDEVTDENGQSTSSISSDAAVASESRERHSGHRDVVFNNDKRSSRKRPPTEVTSLERSFELDYEEVFDKSNIPQLIATTSGKIVTYNDCFVKASGYRKAEIERMTIFSLVRPNKLSDCFGIVASALKSDDDSGGDETGKKTTGNTEESMKSSNTDLEVASTAASDAQKESVVDSKPGLNMTDRATAVKEAHDVTDESRRSTEGNYAHSSCKEDVEGTASIGYQQRKLDFQGITLPCIDFPAMKRRGLLVDAATPIDGLNITITLMGDKDPRRRCFHCVFTNCRGTNGSLGIITPDLLALLFAGPFRRKKKCYHNRRRHNNHKRARIQVVQTTAGQSASSSSNENSSSSTSTNVVSASTSNHPQANEVPKKKLTEIKKRDVVEDLDEEDLDDLLVHHDAEAGEAAS
jgi:hypothetical protein